MSVWYVIRFAAGVLLVAAALVVVTRTEFRAVQIEYKHGSTAAALEGEADMLTRQIERREMSESEREEKQARLAEIQTELNASRATLPPSTGRAQGFGTAATLAVVGIGLMLWGGISLWRKRAGPKDDCGARRQGTG